MKKLNITMALLISCSLICGCKNEISKKQPLYSPNFINTLMHKDVMPEEPARHSKITMEPAIKLTDEFNKELTALGKYGLNDDAKVHAAAKIATKYLPQAQKLKKEMLEWGDAITPHVEYMRHINSYVDDFVNILGKTQRLANTPIAQRQILQNEINGHKYWQDIHLIGYKHYKLILTKGNREYQLTVKKMNMLKKGMTYRQVVEHWQMPGEHIHGEEYIWRHDNVVFFAGFKRGKLEAWKIFGAY
ncbi:MAG: hypothetical protein Q4D21_09395 [Phascolarctobacterium sp.]|nr:hypothetical protein [Phascolarctobacterium sp.]